MYIGFVENLFESWLRESSCRQFLTRSDILAKLHYPTTDIRRGFERAI